MEQCPSVDHWQTRNPGLELSKTENPSLEKTAGFANPILEAAGYLSTWLRTSHSGGCWPPVNMAQNQPLWRLLATSQHGLEPATLEAAGYEWRYALLWCKPEMMMMMMFKKINLTFSDISNFSLKASNQ